MLNPIQLDDLQSALASHGLRLPADHAAVSPLHRPAALCYIYKDGQVLLLRRLQPPFAGYWTAPGAGAAWRNARRSRPASARGDGTDDRHAPAAARGARVGPRPLLNWLLYVYLAGAFSGRYVSATKGLAWTPVERLRMWECPRWTASSRGTLSDREPLWIEVTLDRASARSISSCAFAITLR